MKTKFKIYAILIAFFLVNGSPELFADAGVRLYKRNGIVQNKYNCWSAVQRDYPFYNGNCALKSRTSMVFCTSQIDFFEQWLGGYHQINGAKAVSWVGPGGPGSFELKVGGYPDGGYRAGFRNSYSILDQHQMTTFPESINTNESSGMSGIITTRDTFSNVIFDSSNRTITIKDYFSNFSLQSSNLNSLYLGININAVVNNNTLDSINPDSYDSVFKSLHIYLEGKVLTLNGFNSTDFVITTNTDSTYGCMFVGADIVIIVPENVNFENTGIVCNAYEGEITNSSQNNLMNNEKIEEETELVSIYPNPAVNGFNLIIDSHQKSAKNVIYIYNLNGQILSEKSVELVEGKNIIYLPIEHLPKGQYIIKLQGQGGNYDWKILKE